VVRLRDFEQAGFPKAKILRLCDAGELQRVGRGLYALPEREVSESEALIQVARRVPNGVLCLLTALRLHDLTDQNPSKVWLAVDRKARRPRLNWPPLEIAWWSREVLAFGVIQHAVGGVTLKITSPAKTVADAIKYRNKLGTDVALQALRDYRRKRLAMDDLFAAARFCRVDNILRRYMEAMA
jgi:predicted transcriptional regulator of viral defense system